MKLERETKLRVEDAAEARASVERLGACQLRARHFEDNLLLDDAAGSLAARGAALRLRRTEGRAVLTFKGPAEDRDGLKVRPETEVDVGDADVMQALLGSLGFGPAFRYQKFRESWTWKDVEIVVDETPLGCFLEIEGSAETIHEAARALGRDPADYVLLSYPALFRAAGGRGDMVF